MLENSETKVPSLGLNHLSLKVGLNNLLFEKNELNQLSLVVEFPSLVLFIQEKQVYVCNFKKSCFSASTRYAHHRSLVLFYSLNT